MRVSGMNEFADTLFVCFEVRTISIDRRTFRLDFTKWRELVHLACLLWPYTQ